MAWEGSHEDVPEEDTLSITGLKGTHVLQEINCCAITE